MPFPFFILEPELSGRNNSDHGFMAGQNPVGTVNAGQDDLLGVSGKMCIRDRGKMRAKSSKRRR